MILRSVMRLRLHHALLTLPLRISVLLAWLLACGVLSAAGQPTLLMQESTVTRDLAPGAFHTFHLALDEATYIAARLDVTGTTATLELFAPDGTWLRRFDGFGQDEPAFQFIAESDGTHRLEIHSSEESRTGSYTLEVEEVLPPLEPPVATAVTVESPRLAALEAGTLSTEVFWNEVEKQGAPLLEPLDEDQYLVTFLWRGTPQTQSVYLRWPVWMPLEDLALTRLPDTDVWFKSLTLPHGARFSYQMAPNVPRMAGQPRAARRRSFISPSQADPLNPHRWPSKPRASKYDTYSLLDLPGAPPQRWVEKHPATPLGHVETHRLASRLLENERDVFVYTPANYAPDAEPYPLLILFDADRYLHPVDAPTILDNLIAAAEIPPLVAVFVSNPSSATRGQELPCNPTFADFLATELMPWLHKHYPITSDPDDIVVGGASYGGLAAAYAAYRHPETFGNVLSQSGSFWWAPSPEDPRGMSNTAREPNWLVRQYATAPRTDVAFYLNAGTFEAGSDILPETRHLRDVLVAKGYAVQYHEFLGGHDDLQWQATLADGLIALYSHRNP